MTEYNLKILQIIQERTKSCPITGAEIIRILNIKENPRTFGAKLRQIVNSLRREVYPICAAGNGYYWPSSVEELKEYLDSFKGRIICMHEAYDSLLRGHDKMHADWIIQQLKITAKQESLFIPANQVA